MSLFYGIMVRQRCLYRKLRELFPGVILNCYEYGVPISGLEKMVSCPYDNLPDDLRVAADQLEMNRGLSEIIDCKLDRIYSVSEAEYYLDNYEVFEASFAMYRGRMHSAENIIGDLGCNNFVVRNASSEKCAVELLCDYKSLDLSDRYNPRHAFMKAVVSIQHDKSSIFAANVNRLISASQASSEKNLVVSRVSPDDEILTLVRWL